MSAMRSAGRRGGLMTVAAAVGRCPVVGRCRQRPRAGRRAARRAAAQHRADPRRRPGLRRPGRLRRHRHEDAEPRPAGAPRASRLTDFYANAPVCTPTRAGLITGRYQQRVMMERPLSSAGADLEAGLPVDRAIAAAAAGGRRLRHRLIGKWHLGFKPEVGPRAHGFGYFWGYLSGYLDWYTHVRGDGAARPVGERVADHRHAATSITKPRGARSSSSSSTRARAVLPRPRPTARRTGRSSRRPRRRWRAREQLDDAAPLGRQRADAAPTTSRSWRTSIARSARCSTPLRAIGLEQNTLVVFMSDNGGEWLSRNDPLFNRKDTVWEGGIRVPAILRWPGVVPADGSRARLAITMDLTASLLAIAGVSRVPTCGSRASICCRR